ncbi:SRPBCC family protein [Actinoplanes sp. KI2]|uniref:SRPBCC family protein n=1 Tax=Actinoplanes sp. KI2 TaxID=2983315 RepID=UPI0021D5CAED|nr:SRPBCC family protein [Actinoplanes sp. KI2]MCU7730135.1 SRPBCC family protein [Actinoplanes sp. KI2]
MSMVQQAIEVGAPLHTVYEQLAAFENYPRFMSGVREVTPVGADQTHWIMDVDGKRREFDAQITERSLDERVSWSTMEGPLLAETITLRPLGETKTQIVAQLEADIAFLMPSDRHGQASLTKRLKEDLTTFKGLLESGVLGGRPKPVGSRPSPKRPTAGANTMRLAAVSNPAAANPAAVAARIRNRNPQQSAGWGSSAAERGTASRISPSPHDPDAGAMGIGIAGIQSQHDLDDPSAAGGRRIAKAGPISGGAAGTAPMGRRTIQKDAWGDGMINEEDRGSAHDM